MIIDVTKGSVTVLRLRARLKEADLSSETSASIYQIQGVTSQKTVILITRTHSQTASAFWLINVYSRLMCPEVFFLVIKTFCKYSSTSDATEQYVQ
jgi:hypothetical protein